MKKIYNILILSSIITIQNVNSQTPEKNQFDEIRERHYVATSVFVLSSFIPNDNTFFYELDYGYRLNLKTDLVAGANIYQYTMPMSAPWNETEAYPGKVLSCGVLAACQYYAWKNFFIDQMLNPLVLRYNNPKKTSKESGFMILLATRVGYHFDFKMFSQSFYLEPGAEISYWPVNTNVPQEFNVIDEGYKSYVFSPALQFGIKF